MPHPGAFEHGSGHWIDDSKTAEATRMDGLFFFSGFRWTTTGNRTPAVCPASFHQMFREPALELTIP